MNTAAQASAGELLVPIALQKEFDTVVAVWNSKGTTRAVDALVLSWVKYEKQLRRLFCFLVYQHPQIGSNQIKEVIAVLAENDRLNPKTFGKAIKELGVKSVEELVGPRHEKLSKQIARIRKVRNKLVHGLNTGERIGTPQLERDVGWIVEWVSSLAKGAHDAFGYDGLKRNTFHRAKASRKIAIAQYPFSTPQDFKNWLSAIANGPPKLQTVVKQVA